VKPGRTLLALMVGGPIAVALVLAAVWTLRSVPPPDPELAAARATAASIVAAMKAAQSLQEPVACARWPPDTATAEANTPPLVAWGRTFDRSGPELNVTGGDPPLKIGFVSDARSDAQPTLDHLSSVRAAFARAEVELVVSLGGMGETEAEIAHTLGELARGNAWPIVAIPGPHESLAAHRAAIDFLVRSGQHTIFDGSQIRMVRMDGVTIGTIPGGPEPSQLVAGADGCVYFPEQVAAFADTLAQQPSPRVLASYTPPRQTGNTGSDLAEGAIHIGDPTLAQAVQRASPVAVIHGLLDEAGRGPTSPGLRRAGTLPLIVGTGAAEGMPLWLPNGQAVGSSAVLVVVGRSQVRWRRLAPERNLR
jgi:hypothetical protein